MTASFRIIPIAQLTPSVTRAQIERRAHFLRHECRCRSYDGAEPEDEL